MDKTQEVKSPAPAEGTTAGEEILAGQEQSCRSGVTMLESERDSCPSAQCLLSSEDAAGLTRFAYFYYPLQQPATTLSCLLGCPSNDLPKQYLFFGAWGKGWLSGHKPA